MFKPKESANAPETNGSGKNLVAYFSRIENYYRNGKVDNITIGKTEVVAKKIQALTGSDIFHVDTVHKYPEGYDDTTDVAKKEKNEDARPTLTAKVENMDQYEVIYVGSPNWWNTMPMAVFTFLESYNFSGKTIIPFITHEGSGLGSIVRDIQRLCPEAKVLSGLAISAGNVNSSDSQLKSWLKGHGQID